MIVKNATHISSLYTKLPGISPRIMRVNREAIVKIVVSVIMSTENFARYDGYISLLQTLDSSALVDLYQRYYPLLQQAWEENGGEGTFNSRLLEVIGHLQQTPELPEQVVLVKPEAVYLFEDPQLETLSAGQKLLVRMGPANAAVIREKLAEIETGITGA